MAALQNILIYNRKSGVGKSLIAGELSFSADKEVVS